MSVNGRLSSQTLDQILQPGNPKIRSAIEASSSHKAITSPEISGSGLAQFGPLQVRSGPTITVPTMVRSSANDVSLSSPSVRGQGLKQPISLESSTIQDPLSEVSASISATSIQDGPRAGGFAKATDNDSDALVVGTDLVSPISPQSWRGSDHQLADDHRSKESRKSGADRGKTGRPAWSELKTKAGKERKRLPLACIACRRKKIRCSGEKPACKHCLRSRIPCVYKVTTRKPAPRTDYMTMLDKRLKRMEERVIKIMPDQDINKLAAIGRASVKAQVGQTLRTAGPKKRAAEEAFGRDLNEWANGAPTGGLARQFPGLDPTENRLLSEGSEHLPPRDIQDHLSEVFFDYLYGQSYHVLHKPSFMRKLKAGKVPPVLVLAVCAVSARFSTHPQVGTDPAFLRGEAWAKPARDIALRRYDEPSITILTVYLILGLHEFGTCQGGRSWMFCGMAMRMAYALQLHREVDHDPMVRKSDKSSELSPTDREIRRRTMWACFLMDRFNSSGTERPSIAIEAHIKVQLPVKESHFQMEISGPTEDLDGRVPNPVAEGLGQVTDARANMGVAAYLIKVIALWGRVVRYLNLGGKDRDPYPLCHPESGFMELKEQVKDFATDLPESLKYSTEALSNFAAEKLGNQFLYLHISYYQTILFLHKFAIPSAPGGKLPSDLPKDFVSQCAKTAVDAAGKISAFMSEAITHLVVAPFAGYCAFASSIVHVWGIFSSNPQLEASSKRDLTSNVKYLTHMKKHWGMFHHMVENLKSIYRQFADWASQGPNASTAGRLDAAHFQYGDWFDKYPHGVSGTDYEDPAVHELEESNNAALSQKSDLQSVEDFFQTNPVSSPSQQRKIPRRQAYAGSRNSAQSRQPAVPNLKTEQPGPHVPGATNHQSRQNLDGQAPATDRSHAMQHPLNSAAYPMFSSAYYPDVPDLSGALYSSGHHFPVTEMDRHLVLGAYAQDMSSTPVHQRIPTGAGQQQLSPQDANPGTGRLDNQAPDATMNPLMWNQGPEFGIPTVEGAPYQDGMQSSAWFMPFNLVPPGTGGDDVSVPYGHGLHNVNGTQLYETAPPGRGG